MIDIQKLLDIAEQLQEKENLEKGKSFFAALSELDANLAAEIKETKCDPSLGEKNYIPFMNALLTYNLRVEKNDTLKYFGKYLSSTK